MKKPRPILVAGIGNSSFGDDAFGSEVVRALKHHGWPDHVRVEDFGVRSHDIADALMGGADTVFIGTIPRGEPPGTICLIAPDLENLGASPAHGYSMNTLSVLQMISSLGGRTGRLFLVGCEPGSQEGKEGLSGPVQVALPEAIALVERVVADLIYNKNPIPKGTFRPALAETLNGVR